MNDENLHEFEKAGYGPGPYEQLAILESTDLAYVCDNCGQHGLRYKFTLRSATGQEFGVGSECIKKADPELWLRLKHENGIRGDNISAVMVKRKDIFDKAQPVRKRLIELGYPYNAGVKLFADIENIKKKQVKTLQKTLDQMQQLADRIVEQRARVETLRAQYEANARRNFG